MAQYFLNVFAGTTLTLWQHLISRKRRKRRKREKESESLSWILILKWMSFTTVWSWTWINKETGRSEHAGRNKVRMPLCEENATVTFKCVYRHLYSLRLPIAESESTPRQQLLEHFLRQLQRWGTMTQSDGWIHRWCRPSFAEALIIKATYMSTRDIMNQLAYSLGIYKRNIKFFQSLSVFVDITSVQNFLFCKQNVP